VCEIMVGGGMLAAGRADLAQMRSYLYQADGVLIATRDSTHADFIIQTLDAGKRAISEKPLCVDAAQCRAILKCAAKAKRKGAIGYVTHNMRYTPSILEFKRLLASGAIGEIKAVNFQEYLDRRHGADYFRRWHRVKANSGGLLIHKASHHFDCLNWLVDSAPVELVAQNRRQPGAGFQGDALVPEQPGEVL